MKQVWFASGGGIVRCGPFPTARAAREAMRLTDAARKQQQRERGTGSPFVFDFIAWPEREEAARARRRR